MSDFNRVNKIKKYSKKSIFILATLFLVIFASGCWDSMDINNMHIATAIAFDVKEDEIFYYMEYPNIKVHSKDDGASGSNVKKCNTLVGIGATIPEARINLDHQLNKKPYFSGISALILTENFAKEYLVEYLYRFRAEEHYRKKSLIVITKEDPKKIFDLIHEKNDSLGFTIDELITTLDDSGKSFSRTASRLIENLSSDYTGILVSCIGVQDENIVLDGYCVISGTKVIGFIPAEGSNGLVFLKAVDPKFSYIVSYEDIKYTFGVALTDKTTKTYYEDGDIRFDIKCEFKAELKYGDKKIPYDFNDKAKAAISKILTKTLKKELLAAIAQAQKEFKCDYLQLDDEFRLNFPAEFEDMDWQKEFPLADINIDVNFEVDTEWMMDYEFFKTK